MRKLPYAVGLRTFSTPSVIWSKGVGTFCDFAGPSAYRLAPTESTQPDAFFERHYRKAHGLVWLRLGTTARDHRPCDVDGFVKVALPTIDRPFILITTDGDATVPSDLREETVAALTGHPCLIAWYSQNSDGSHPKVKPFPIGLDLHTLRPWSTPARLLSFLHRLGHEALPAQRRPLRVFSDLNLTITDARREAIEALEGSDHFDMAETRVSQTEIWRRYAGYPFVLSAHGNGLDCHRTWEALALGCIVVTKSSSLDPLYDGLPVVILDDWRLARNPALLSRWIDDFAPLTAPGYIRERLRTEAWIKPMRQAISELRVLD